MTPEIVLVIHIVIVLAAFLVDSIISKIHYIEKNGSLKDYDYSKSYMGTVLGLEKNELNDPKMFIFYFILWCFWPVWGLVGLCLLIKDKCLELIKWLYKYLTKKFNDHLVKSITGNIDIELEDQENQIINHFDY